MNKIIEEILPFLLYPEFTGILYYIRMVFLIISAILFSVILILLPKISWFKHRYSVNFKEFFTSSPLESNKLARRWAEIVAKIESKVEGNYKMAIIEADNMFSDSLEKVGIKGETFSEKIDQVTIEKLKNKEDVINAHKIRNNIVYDPGYKIEIEEAKRTIDIYREAFQNLDIF